MMDWLLRRPSADHDMSRRVAIATQVHGEVARHAVRAGVANAMLADDAHEVLQELLDRMEQPNERPRDPIPS